jgi:hypothetical protein
MSGLAQRPGEKYRGKIRIIGFDRPFSKEIQEDFSKALYWKIRKFILAW